MDVNALTVVLKKVLLSWEVIAITIAVLCYVALVRYVVNPHKRPQTPSIGSGPSKKAAADAVRSVKESSPEVVDEDADLPPDED